MRPLALTKQCNHLLNFTLKVTLNFTLSARVKVVKVVKAVKVVKVVKVVKIVKVVKVVKIVKIVRPGT